MMDKKATKIEIIVLAISSVILTLEYLSILRFIMLAGAAAAAGVSVVLLIWSIPAVHRRVKLYLRKTRRRVKKVRLSRPGATD